MASFLEESLNKKPLFTDPLIRSANLFKEGQVTEKKG